ncbi:hypothetical protein FRC03_010427 [Tulasnella sp. 419]|nr:hypothetical protein FRC03_010427 [Tulasnella sp. 419]
MACVSVPTETRYRTDVVTVPADGGSTISRSTITAEPTAITSVKTVCAQSDSVTSCSEDVIITNIPGDPIVTDIVIPISSFSVSTNLVPTLTLYSTSCGETSTSRRPEDPDTTTTTSTTPRQDDPQPTSTTTPPPVDRPTTSSEEIILGTPTVVTSLVYVTLPNGSVTMTTSVGLTTPTLSRPDASKDNSGSSSIGMIIGAAVGGFVGFSVLVGLLWLLWKRRSSRWDDIFDKEFEEEEDEVRRRRSMNLLDNEPKPYQYGIVGTHIPPSHAAGSVHSRSTSHTGLLTHRTGHSAEMLPHLPPMAHSSNTSSDFNLPPSQTYPPPQHKSPVDGRRPPSAGAISTHAPSASFASHQSGTSSLQVPGANSPPPDEMGKRLSGSHSATTSPVSPFSDQSVGPSFAGHWNQQSQNQGFASGAGPSSPPRGMMAPTPPGPSYNSVLIPPRDKSVDRGEQRRRPVSSEIAPPPYSLSPTSDVKPTSPSLSDTPLVPLGNSARLGLTNPDLLDSSPPTSPDLRRRR